MANDKVADTPKRMAQQQNKNCGQCEVSFTKSQKCMFCNVCKFWFCLECAHVSNKLYEMLKRESSTNLPFNCDGCKRLLPTLMEIATKCKGLEERISRVEETLQETVEKKVELAVEAYREREERKCNIIIHNVPEGAGENPAEEDEKMVKTIFGVMKCEGVTVTSIVRLGLKPVDGKKRLMKVGLESVDIKHQLLGGTKFLRAKDLAGESLHEFGNVFVTPDMTKEERDQNAALRQELSKRKRDEKNDDLVIYRHKIVDKKEITGGRVEPNRPDTVNSVEVPVKFNVYEVKSCSSCLQTVDVPVEIQTDNDIENTVFVTENEKYVFERPDVLCTCSSQKLNYCNQSTKASCSTSKNLNTEENMHNVRSEPSPKDKYSAQTEILCNKVKCFYTNADQLKNKIDELKVQIELENPDFIFVTEVLPKAYTDILCSSVLFSLEGYNAFPSKDGNRGVIIYAKSALDVSSNDMLNSMYGDASWCNWVTEEGNVLVGAIYRSPSDNENCNAICELLNKAASLKCA